MSTSTALDLLERSEESLSEAARAECTSVRYLQSQVAALRAAAALVAVRSRTGQDRAGNGRWERMSRPRSLWRLVSQQAPELGEWADFFAACTARRARVEAGHAVVSAREADDLLRQTETFVDLVSGLLGLPRSQGRTALLAPASARRPALAPDAYRAPAGTW